MKRLFSMVLILTLVFVVLSGCNREATKSKTEEPEAVKPGQTEQQNPGSNPTNGVKPEENSNEDSSKEVSAKVFKAVLYYHDNEAMNVIKEERDIPVESEQSLDVTQKAKVCIEELVKGSNDGLATSIPKSTKVMSIKLDQNTLIVDLSREFEQEHIGGSAGVLMTMSQLVLTLTELEGVQQVSFRIEGRTLEDFKGAIEFSKPFVRSDYEQYLKK